MSLRVQWYNNKRSLVFFFSVCDVAFWNSNFSVLFVCGGAGIVWALFKAAPKSGKTMHTPERMDLGTSFDSAFFMEGNNSSLFLEGLFVLQGSLLYE